MTDNRSTAARPQDAFAELDRMTTLAEHSIDTLMDELATPVKSTVSGVRGRRP